MSSPSFKTSLKSILEEPFNDGWHKTIDKKMDAILSLIRQTMPEVTELDQDGRLVWEEGVTQLRTTFLERLES